VLSETLLSMPRGAQPLRAVDTDQEQGTHKDLMALISVIIPVWNGKPFVEEAIRSVFSQTYPALEIIIVDDGSTDGTKQVVSRLAGPIPITCLYQERQGVAVARNTGVSVARGDWIAFLDQDDVWYPHKLQVLADCFKTHPETAFFFSGGDIIDAKGNPVPLRLQPNELSREVYQSDHTPLPSTIILRTEAYKQAGGFNASLGDGSDIEFAARIAKQWPPRYISRSLVKYRFHPFQASRNTERMSEIWPKLHQCLHELWRDDAKRRALLVRHAADTYARFAKHYFGIGRYDQARRFFRLAFSCRPWHWSNLRRWAISYVPGVREAYRKMLCDRYGPAPK
jgi:glycosyltransferase involved in cell wall biosynthesis